MQPDIPELDPHSGAGVELEGNDAGGRLVVRSVNGYGAVELELDAAALGEDLVFVPVVRPVDLAANLPALVLGLHEGAAASLLLVEVAPGGFFGAGFGEVGLVAGDDPAGSGQDLAAELDAAVVVAEADFGFEKEVGVGCLINEESVLSDGMVVGGAY